mmetsp:Transcript_34492/g.43546  ORF Transcript_34492/g.43546 Transcript_34492/m.43546 type:complete len:954 (-) Transcript_34492:361-3222(-)
MEAGTQQIYASQSDIGLGSSGLFSQENVKKKGEKLQVMLVSAHQLYNTGRYKDAATTCEAIYQIDAYRTDNLLLLGAVHFQLRNFSECIFYNQQCIRVDPNFAEAYSNLGNALKELGDVQGAIQFYLKAIKLKPRFCDAYSNLASAHMQMGQLQEATETYQMALVLNPKLVDAHSNLGNLFKAQGKLEEAKVCYLKAIKLNPEFAIAWSNLAGAFKEDGQLETAVAYYKEALRLHPDFADAHSNLGNALKEQGCIQEAMACYQTAIKLRPDFAIAFGNLASCYYDLGQMDLAIRTFKYALQLEPNFPDAYNNLGNALRETGQLDEAVLCYRTALKLKPDHPHAYNNLGNAMKDKGLVKESIHCYVTAIRLMPRFAAAHSNLGSLLKEQGKLDQALAHYQEAITIQPKFADAYSNMGNAYKDLGRLQDAIKCYTTAIKVKPTFSEAYSNLASAYKDGGQIEEAIACYRRALELKPDFPDAFANLVHSLAFICAWETRSTDFAQLSKMLEKQMAGVNVLPSVQPFHALVYPLSLAEMQLISKKYAERAKMNVALLDMPPFTFRPKLEGSRIKIGYVSSDFGNHPLSHLMQSVFGLHNKRKFDVTCYALTPSDQSVWRQKIESEVENFKDISQLQNGDAARLIHSDGIDILINLNGYTKGARNEIFALKPAPLQVSYMGFCGTLGADYVQYMIVDREVVPPAYRQFYSEHLLYMSHSYFVNDHRQSARYIFNRDELPLRSQYNVPEDKFVFCNFNQLYKIDPDIFDTWMNILKRVPNAILWLLRFPPTGEKNIRMEARARGVRDDQIHFTNVAPKVEHIKRGYCADLFLDTPCCNAHTTGCDILWSGTPMITLSGEKQATRVAASLLKAGGVEELIVANREEYEELAVKLATDPDKLFEIRNKLENTRNTSPLFDTKRWVQNMETGLEEIYRRHVEGKDPADYDIPDIHAPRPGSD